jgi:YcxB-like protein
VELEYTVEEGDLAAFLDYHSHHSAALREIRRSQMYGYAILFAIFAVIFWFFGETAVAISFLVLGPVWAAWWPSRARRLAREQAVAVYRDDPAAMKPGLHTLSLDSDGLRLAGAAGERRLPLSSVRGLVNLPEHLLIYVGEIQAIIVPRERSTKGDVAAFASALKGQLK